VARYLCTLIKYRALASSCTGACNINASRARLSHKRAAPRLPLLSRALARLARAPLFSVVSSRAHYAHRLRYLARLATTATGARLTVTSPLRHHTAITLLTALTRILYGARRRAYARYLRAVASFCLALSCRCLYSPPAVQYFLPSRRTRSFAERHGSGHGRHGAAWLNISTWQHGAWARQSSSTLTSLFCALRERTLRV